LHNNWLGLWLNKVRPFEWSNWASRAKELFEHTATSFALKIKQPSGQHGA